MSEEAESVTIHRRCPVCFVPYVLQRESTKVAPEDNVCPACRGQRAKRAEAPPSSDGRAGPERAEALRPSDEWSTSPGPAEGPRSSDFSDDSIRRAEAPRPSDGGDSGERAESSDDDAGRAEAPRPSDERSEAKASGDAGFSDMAALRRERTEAPCPSGDDGVIPKRAEAPRPSDKSKSMETPAEGPRSSDRSSHALQWILSGGQTGADRGALDAAIELGIPHTGYCPAGRRAEDGTIPARYRLREHASRDYPQRTLSNVQASEGVLIFVRGAVSPGAALTRLYATKEKKPVRLVNLRLGAGEGIGDWVRAKKISKLLVAGTRESGAPGIRAEVQRILVRELGRAT